MAARLAGGFLTAVEPGALAEAAAQALKVLSPTEMGDLSAIRDLPGVPKTVVLSLRRAWAAGLDLGAAAAAPGAHPRLGEMARVEAAVLQRLAEAKPCQLRPADLAAKAMERLQHAPAVLGEVEFRGLPDLDRCWRRLVLALARVTNVVWDCEPFETPAWLDGSGVEIRRGKAWNPKLTTFSCATPRHEVVEALRWARRLMAEQGVKPQEIAIAAASTAPYDDFIFFLGTEANLPVHFGHGRNALHTAEGQTAAALADVLLRGLSQERVRRLATRAGKGTKLAKLPKDWTTKLSSSATLTTAERWKQALAKEEAREVADILSPVIELLEQGSDVAAQAGEDLLNGAARELWRRALAQAPGSAIERELGTLRVKEADDPDPEAAIAWMPASALASCPRPYVWLLGLNAQAWPRPAREDPLLPQRVLGGFVLEEVSTPKADRRSFKAIEISTTVAVARSFSRREAGGRLLGRSPLLNGAEVTYLQRTRIPEHAMSEPDRLMARPGDFSGLPVAQSAKGCWDDWRNRDITAHDGLVAANHGVIEHALRKPQSATSLALLLRNPIAFMWAYALGMSAPEIDVESVELDRRAFGSVVHRILDQSVLALEADGGMASATPDRIAEVVAERTRAVGLEWQTEQPVPPDMLWRAELRQAETMVVNALRYPLGELKDQSGQRSFTEVPFGGGKNLDTARDLPWDPALPVTVPKAGLTIAGRIDRVDISADGTAARVVDYKTGRHGGEYVLNGGRELQRCLYAYAVRALLGGDPEIESALLFPAKSGDAAGHYDVLPDPSGTLDILSKALADAAEALRQGRALPGVAAGATWKSGGEDDDYAFALPVVPGTMLGPKKDSARKLLPETVISLWERA
ncbi:PD-(D/E)XK nuclease family protein [Siccirubricoccus sp. KC 17139]|uniref:PD-(D/E)XK nuclease family protein n=1 Tax=Siccirubricoccus soli TaxID=2899147 RepID=A0ABT1D1Q3_9PROT|nr:PD-(D/E)XK nuclease family protein [Siccirubricoccus soli]MCO6415852.1 PD-(D/E)XK nuclease family protein [Siccirubricoccus soli]MCP2681984.1 PD-(D/E)XK nuclease family protein [Siccirubricoccus soli]